MRQIKVPAVDWDEVVGSHAVVVVKVDWPEVRLTHNQVLANAFAKADGRPEPFPDHSFVEVVLERP